MPERHTKREAETILRELPSVLGAFVREDIHGNPREVHLLVRPGPTLRDLARDVRDLLEERLGVPVDQRVVSIAQLADPAEAASLRPPASPSPDEEEPPRLEFLRLESELGGGRVSLRVVLRSGDSEVVGEAREVDAPNAAARAAARATAAAISSTCGSLLRLDIDTVSTVSAFDREHVLVNTLAASPLFGRASRTIVGAHPVGPDAREAAVLAVLKSSNRLVGLALRRRAEQETDQAVASSSDRNDAYSPVTGS